VDMNRVGWSLLLYFYLRFVQLIHQLFSSVVSLLLIRWTHKNKICSTFKIWQTFVRFQSKTLRHNEEVAKVLDSYCTNCLVKNS